MIAAARAQARVKLYAACFNVVRSGGTAARRSERSERSERSVRSTPVYVLLGSDEASYISGSRYAVTGGKPIL